MDTTTRLVTKSITWQIGGLLSMTIIGYLFTGSFAASSGIAIAGSIAGFIAYFLHELVWSKVKWGAVTVTDLKEPLNSSNKTRPKHSLFAKN